MEVAALEDGAVLTAVSKVTGMAVGETEGAIMGSVGPLGVCAGAGRAEERRGVIWAVSEGTAARVAWVVVGMEGGWAAVREKAASTAALRVAAAHVEASRVVVMVGRTAAAVVAAGRYPEAMVVAPATGESVAVLWVAGTVEAVMVGTMVAILVGEGTGESSLHGRG